MIQTLLEYTTLTGYADYVSGILPPPKHEPNRFDDKAGNRFYWFYDNDIKIASGVTGWLKKVMPESIYLTDWKLQYGKDWVKVLDILADYGTALHAIYADILISGSVSQERIDIAKQYLNLARIYNIDVSRDIVEKNIWSFIRWVHDYNVEPLLVEGRLAYPFIDNEYSCLTLDLLCNLSFKETVTHNIQTGYYVRGKNKGLPKFESVKEESIIKKAVIIDFKSNFFEKTKKVFFDSHKYQLMEGALAIKYNYGIDIEHLYNWTPLGWEKEPKYQFYKHNISDEDVIRLNLYKEIVKLDGLHKPNGKFRYYEPPNLAANSSNPVKEYSYYDIVQQLYEYNINNRQEILQQYKNNN